jgi:transmembrane sensor
MEEEQIYNLFAKHFSGETTPDEENIINLWLKEDPLNKDQYDEMKNLWGSTSPADSSWDVDRAWKNLAANTIVKQKHVFTLSFITRTINARFRYANIAAVFLVIICGYFLIKQSGVLNQRSKEIILPDNSKVMLNGSSRLKYPKRFNGNSREVDLDGEAYFEVAHNPSYPFVVHSGKISTTALGTKFNVSCFASDKSITVSLIEGKVKISKKELNEVQPIVILQPDQQLVYSREANVSTVEQFDADKTIGWKDDILKFDNEPLSQIFVRLERAYGPKFELGVNSFKDFKVTANFKKESCLTVTEVLKKLTGLRVKTTKENNEVKTITFEEK